MGKLIKIRCDTCGYEQVFRTGGGMRDWDMNVVRGALSEEEARQFDAFVQAGMESAMIDRQLGICMTCRMFILLPSVICRMPDGTEKKIENHCPNCSSHSVEPVLVENGDRPVFCPKCKEAVSVSLIGFWD